MIIKNRTRLIGLVTLILKSTFYVDFFIRSLYFKLYIKVFYKIMFIFINLKDYKGAQNNYFMLLLINSGYISKEIHNKPRMGEIFMFKEFKEFALQGNVLDLAVGVIIGGAFGKIITSLVNDVIMPVIGLIVGGSNFAALEYVIGIDGKEPIAIKYGEFIQSAVDFLIIAFSIFMFIRVINSFKKKEMEIPEEPPEPTKEELLLGEIRDILKQGEEA